MEFFGNFWPLILAAGILGAFVAPIIGYLRGQVGAPSRATIQGSAIIDSSALRELTVETRRQALAVERMAEAMESILTQMGKTAAAEAERARVAAAVAAEIERREREHRERNQRDQDKSKQ